MVIEIEKIEIRLIKELVIAHKINHFFVCLAQHLYFLFAKETKLSYC